MSKIEDLIEKKEARVAIIGLGYVGLPHAVEVARAGFSVLGVDIQEERVNLINEGKSYIEDVEEEELGQVVKNKKLEATSDFSLIKNSDVVIICVPTPLDRYKIPDISYIKSAAEKIKKYLNNFKLIILESTTYPGTTEEVLLPIFESKGGKVGEDFCLAFAPERIDPGNQTPLSEIPKVVGGITKKCVDLSKAFYSQFLEKVHPVSSTKAAEMTKLLENTYRLVNISAINELALLCNKMNIDIWEIIEAAKTKPYGFHAFYPSPKVGGHCIPLDPFYLSWKAREYNFWARFIELAGEINESMPHFIMVKVGFALNKKGRALNGSKILIMGVSYKKDIADPRESAAFDVIYELQKKGASVDFHDPYVDELEIKNHRKDKPILLKSVEYSPQILKEYDCVLILADHSCFDPEEVAKHSKLVVDTRNLVKSREHKNVFWL